MAEATEQLLAASSHPHDCFRDSNWQTLSESQANEKLKKAYRVWIIKEEKGFYALFAKCTHLGCTPNWLPAEAKFKCPCHGSGFFKDGTNFEGPAPRPLDRFPIEVAEDGSLIVDKAHVYHMNAGLAPDEQYPESILKA